MSTEIMFVHISRDSRIVELPLPATRTGAALYAALLTAGLLEDENLRIFIDEGEDEVMKDCEEERKGLKHGCRVHLNHCTANASKFECTTWRKRLSASSLQEQEFEQSSNGRPESFTSMRRMLPSTFCKSATPRKDHRVTPH
jgi:hypothetical protein